MIKTVGLGGGGSEVYLKLAHIFILVAKHK